MSPGWARAVHQVAWLALLAPAPCRAENAVAQITPDLVALGRLPHVRLPPVPAYVLDQTAGLWSVEDIGAQFDKVTDRVPAINFTRSTFVRPDHRWLVAFNRWFMRMQKELKITYANEAWDCDDFAQSFVAFANLIAFGGGETRGSICMGWATVANVHAFGGVSGSGIGAHAVVIVGTTDGLFVIEPQSGKMAALSSYPNNIEIEAVYF